MTADQTIAFEDSPGLRRALVLGHAEDARAVLIADLDDDPVGAVVAAHRALGLAVIELCKAGL